jgi:hypothetical protein
MAKFKIVYSAAGNRPDEEVEASGYSDDPPWINFHPVVNTAREPVLRVRADDVERIEKVG